MKVFAFSGSLRTGSWNTKLLQLVVPLLRARGVEVDEWNFRAANIPVYDPDVHDTQPPPSLTDARERVRAAQGLLVVSPEYNNSIPGSLKNLIDFLSRPPQTHPFRGKYVAQLGATPGGFGTILGQAALRQVFNALQCTVHPGHFVVSSAPAAFDDEGQLKEEKRRAEFEKFINGYVDALARVA